ncbi:hypothetical protein BS17DRAFT_770018 [Gyrodon lividus]|nr:hypothetical protein BS17DRAFT_770018 [Gyrodon lividus]
MSNTAGKWKTLHHACPHRSDMIASPPPRKDVRLTSNPGRLSAIEGPVAPSGFHTYLGPDILGPDHGTPAEISLETIVKSIRLPSASSPFERKSDPHFSTRRKSNGTGTRKNATTGSLVPVDAPTQPCKYLTPSATSRKELPAIFARKRTRAAAFGDEEDQHGGDVIITPTMSEQEQIEAKRRQNTIAARRSRERKLEYQRQLEENAEQYKRESEIWKQRTMTCQALLRSHRIDCPEFPDS